MPVINEIYVVVVNVYLAAYTLISQSEVVLVRHETLQGPRLVYLHFGTRSRWVKRFTTAAAQILGEKWAYYFSNMRDQLLYVYIYNNYDGIKQRIKYP